MPLPESSVFRPRHITVDGAGAATESLFPSISVLTVPACVGTVAETLLRLPGFGAIKIRLKPGSIGWTPRMNLDIAFIALAPHA